MEPVIGAPAVVGFGNGFNNNYMDIGLATLLLAQRQGTDFCNLSRDVQSTASANHVAIEKNGAANQVSIVETAHNIEVAIEKTAAATQIAIAGTLLEAQKIAGIAALTAATNHAATLAAIAECCCKTQSLIIEKANNTDALIRQLDADNTKLALSDAKNELLAIKYHQKHQD